MLLACLGEVQPFLKDTASSGPADLEGRAAECQVVAEGGLVFGAVKAAVEAEGEDSAVAAMRGNAASVSV